MNNKGEIGFGKIVMAAVLILIGLAFWGSTAGNIGQMTQLRDTYNTSFTLPSAGSTTEIAICGQKAVTTIITNSTSGATVPSTNYTMSQSAGSDGFLAAKITALGGGYAGRSVNVSCNYQPKGYIEDAGSRGIAALIGVFLALLILTAALPDLRNQAVDWVKSQF